MNASIRNQACLCGSNRKSKKCCGTPAAQAQARQKEWDRFQAERKAAREKHLAEMAAKGYVPPAKGISSILLQVALAAAIGKPSLRRHLFR